MTESQTLERVRSQLMTAIEADLERVPRPRRVRITVVAMAAAVIAVLVVTLPSIVAPKHGPRAFAVREAKDGWVYVSWEKDFADGAALERELRSYGIDVRVKTIPGSPSTVGQAVSGEGMPELDQEPGFRWFEYRGPDEPSFAINPRVYTGSFTLDVAVKAAPGEAYTAAEEAFASGEVLSGLQCVLGDSFNVEQLEPYASRAHTAFIWNVVRPTGQYDDGYRLQDDPKASPDGGLVLEVYPADSDHVRVTVLAAGETPPNGSEPHFLRTSPCSDGEGDRWR